MKDCRVAILALLILVDRLCFERYKIDYSRCAVASAPEIEMPRFSSVSMMHFISSLNHPEERTASIGIDARNRNSAAWHIEPLEGTSSARNAPGGERRSTRVQPTRSVALFGMLAETRISGLPQTARPPSRGTACGGYFGCAGLSLIENPHSEDIGGNPLP